MKYTVLIANTAERQLKKLPAHIRQKVVAVIVALGFDPHPYGSKKLSGYEASYRVRVGDYRVIYEIERSEVTVTILKLGHRKEIYR